MNTVSEITLPLRTDIWEHSTESSSRYMWEHHSLTHTVEVSVSGDPGSPSVLLSHAVYCRITAVSP